MMATGAYQRAPDRDPEVDNQKGTKQAMLTGTVAKYREAASKRLMADPVVREAVVKQALRGRAAYAAAKGPKTDQQAGAGTIAQVGRAFGVDLSGMVPKQ